MELDAAIFPDITNLLYALGFEPILSFVVFALITTWSPMFAKVTVVSSTMKSFHPFPVLYSNETSGGVPTFYIATVEFASSAVNVRPLYSTYSHLLTVECVRFAEMSAMSYAFYAVYEETSWTSPIRSSI
jgi:hypothetical protein